MLWARHGDRHRAEITATRAGQVFGWALIALGVAATFVDIPFVSLWTALLGWFIVTDRDRGAAPRAAEPAASASSGCGTS